MPFKPRSRAARLPVSAGRVTPRDASFRLRQYSGRGELLGDPLDFLDGPLFGAMPTSTLRVLPDLAPPLYEVEDRRTFWPEEFDETSFEPARRLSGAPARLSYPSRAARRQSGRRASRLDTFSPVIAFQDPSRVLICVRRQARREVLHARGFYGRSAMRAPHRNVYSSVSCR